MNFILFHFCFWTLNTNISLTAETQLQYYLILVPLLLSLYTFVCAFYSVYSPYGSHVLCLVVWIVNSEFGIISCIQKTEHRRHEIFISVLRYNSSKSNYYYFSRMAYSIREPFSTFMHEAGIQAFQKLEANMYRMCLGPQHGANSSIMYVY